TLTFFFFNDTATTEIYTLSLHDALPIYLDGGRVGLRRSARPRIQNPQLAADGRTLVQPSQPVACDRTPETQGRQPAVQGARKRSGARPFRSAPGIVRGDARRDDGLYVRILVQRHDARCGPARQARSDLPEAAAAARRPGARSRMRVRRILPPRRPPLWSDGGRALS